ncbi:MAG: hypothetical protein ABMB14_12325 [Myxococcota bacterium]
MVAVWLLTWAAWAGLPADLDPAATRSVTKRDDAVLALAALPGPDATATLIQVLFGDPAEDVRFRAAKILFHWWADAGADAEPFRGVAESAAADADSRIRVLAVRALGDTGDDYTMVTPYLGDDDDAVSAAAWATCERWADRHRDRAAEVRAALKASRAERTAPR